MYEEIDFMTAEVKYHWTAKPRGFDLRLKAEPKLDPIQIPKGPWWPLSSVFH